jgi:hypothetical protein
MKPRISLVRDKTRTLVGDHIASIDINFDQDNVIYATVTYDGYFSSKKIFPFPLQDQENQKFSSENQILQEENPSLRMENQSANTRNFQNQENPLLVSNFGNFQNNFISELNSIKNFIVEETKLSKLNFQNIFITINQDLQKNNEIHQKFQEFSVTNSQIFIGLNQKNQELLLNMQSLINQNHTQLIDKFMAIPNLFQDLKETFGNTILNKFMEGMNQVKTETDKNLQLQIIK